MSYETGSITNVADLIAALADFATAEGWTVSKETSTLLFLENGECKVTMENFSRSVTNYLNPPTNTSTDQELRSTLNTSINAASNDYHSHTGSIVTTDTDVDAVYLNDLATPIAYHFFSGDVGDPAYIHVVIQAAADRYAHMSFGMLDQGSFTHDGVPYLTAGQFEWFQESSTTDGVSTNNNEPDNGIHAGPFDGRFSLNNRNSLQIIPGDAAPAGWPATVVTATNVLDVIEYRSDGMGQFSIADGCLLTRLVNEEPTAFGGRNVMLGVPCIFLGTSSPATGLCCYFGDYPNIRFVNMTGLTPGSEITIQTDTWVVFPRKRQTTYAACKGNTVPSASGASSAQMGIAYKKIV